MAAGAQPPWPGVCGARGNREGQTAPRSTPRHERSKHAAAVNEAMRALMSTMTMKDAIAHFTRHDVVAAPVNTIPQAAQDSHPWERRALAEAPDFLGGGGGGARAHCAFRRASPGGGPSAAGGG